MKQLQIGLSLLAGVLGCSIAPGAMAQQFSVAVYSRTGGWHHESILEAVSAIRELGKLHHFEVFWTEDPNRLFKHDLLARHAAVIFALTTGDVLNDEQQAIFQRYIRNGGGFVGVHSAADTEYQWPWYNKMLGHMFVRHPAIQTATVKVESRDFPGMERFAPRFLATEEWYEFDASRSPDLKYLLSVDESTYQTSEQRRAEAKKAPFHPISWYQSYDGGRAFYTALGHLPATYSDQQFLHHLYGGIYWAATGKGLKTP
ncbi:ThuA domain-containing protein [Steroidobacter sp. S1-65]|uniref:ThuA domain-containing protein n=1 Tax=Steroidobacter gossypii TaxID=2805490 RepID=A0ABS1WZ62_9GAMM|nr:ThuA domain-containing protein [Steroidobacter gossypii]MBM0106263.1 ThuA domain-containing protein [Steroidobacter gossypii]